MKLASKGFDFICQYQSIRLKWRGGKLLIKSLIGCLFCFYPNPLINNNTVKPVLSGHSKIDKTKVLKTNGSFMKVERIAECSLGAFCNTFALHKAIICLKKKN